MEHANDAWVHAFDHDDLFDGAHDLPQEVHLYLIVAHFWLLDLIAVVLDPFELESALVQVLFDRYRARCHLRENVARQDRSDAFIRDLVVVHEGLELLSELLDRRHVFADDVRDELRRAAQFGSDEDEALRKVAQLLALHIHIIAILVRLQIVLHDEWREGFKLHLINVRILVKKLAKLKTCCNFAHIGDWDARL